MSKKFKSVERVYTRTNKVVNKIIKKEVIIAFIVGIVLASSIAVYLFQKGLLYLQGKIMVLIT